jgi:hypothetical protein
VTEIVGTHSVPVSPSVMARAARRSRRPWRRCGWALHGCWYAFGDADRYVLFKAPDDATAAGLLARVASTGAFTSLSATKLLTVEEALEAFSRGGGPQNRAPGAPE